MSLSPFQIREAIAFFVLNYQRLSEFGAVCHRLCAVLDAMDVARLLAHSGGGRGGVGSSLSHRNGLGSGRVDGSASTAPTTSVAQSEPSSARPAHLLGNRVQIRNCLAPRPLEGAMHSIGRVHPDSGHAGKGAANGRSCEGTVNMSTSASDPGTVAVAAGRAHEATPIDALIAYFAPEDAEMIIPGEGVAGSHLASSIDKGPESHGVQTTAMMDLRLAVGMTCTPLSTARSTSSSKSTLSSASQVSFSSDASRSPCGNTPLLEMRECDIQTPNVASTLLISKLSVSLGRDDRLLIIGPSGSGKSSVLRTMARLWRPGVTGSAGVGVEGTSKSGGELEAERRASEPAYGSPPAGGGGAAAPPDPVPLRSARLPLLRVNGMRRGSVHVTPNAFFLPQKPYMKLGTLREQLEYPALAPGSLPTAKAIEALDKVGLSKLAYWLEAGQDAEVRDWSQILSTGEQQRVSFARLWLHRPPLALLDESSSALDNANEQAMYELLAQCCTSYVSVGHRPSLLAYHTHVLQLLGECSYRIVTVDEFESEKSAVEDVTA
jgi:ABC-type lipoprotein export system ATPase subunit